MVKQNIPEQKIALVEVLDHNGNPLAYMPLGSVLRQNLSHRVVVAAVFYASKLILYKAQGTRAGQQGIWDMFSTEVHLGESGEDAGLRAVSEKLGICPESLLAISDISKGQGSSKVATGATNESAIEPNSKLANLSLFKGKVPAHLHLTSLSALNEILLLDQDELAGLCKDVPEMLGAHVLWAAKHKNLFA